MRLDDINGRWFPTPFAVAVFFNFVWEIAQRPLYVGSGSLGNAMWHCFLASLVDGFFVMLILAVGWAALGRLGWFERPGVGGYALMLVSGFAIGVGIEVIAVHVWQRWSYTAQMPLVPGLGIGIVPIAQMLVLPPLIFRVVTIWRQRAIGK